MTTCVGDLTRRRRIDACKYLMENEKTPRWLHNYATMYRAVLVIDMRKRRGDQLNIDMRRADAALVAVTTRYNTMIRTETEHLSQLKQIGTSMVLERVHGPRNYWDSTFIPRLMSCKRQMAEIENTVTRYEVTIRNINESIEQMEGAKARISVADVSDDDEVESFFKDIDEDYELTPVAKLIASPGVHQTSFMRADRDANAQTQATVAAANPQGTEMDEFKMTLLRSMGIILDGSDGGDAGGSGIHVAAPPAAGFSGGRHMTAVMGGSSSMRTEFD
jgi:hypothetical protein